MKKLIASALLALGLMSAGAAPARAAAINCTQLATGVGLCIPKYGTDFSEWARAEIAVFTLLNSSSVIQSTSAAFNLGWVQTKRISGLSVGAAGIWISSATTFTSSATFTGGGGISVVYGVSAATGAFSGPVSAGQLSLTYGIAAATGAFSGAVSMGNLTAADALFRNNGLVVTLSSGSSAGQNFGTITYGVGASNSFDLYGAAGKSLMLGSNGAARILIDTAGTTRVLGELLLGAASSSGLGQIGAGATLGNGARLNFCAEGASSCGGTGALQYFTKGGADADHIWYTDQGGGTVEKERIRGGEHLFGAVNSAVMSTYTYSSGNLELAGVLTTVVRANINGMRIGGFGSSNLSNSIANDSQVRFLDNSAGAQGIAAKNIHVSDNYNSSPPSLLTVDGSAQFGTTSASTFSATGFLSIAGGTAAFASDGNAYFGVASNQAGAPKSGRINIRSKDTLVSPAINIRADAALDYGFDFDHEQVSVGRLDIYAVAASVRTRAMSIYRGALSPQVYIAGPLGVGTEAPTAKVHFSSGTGANGTGVFKFGMISLADDATYPTEVNFGTGGVLTVQALGNTSNATCVFRIKADSNSAAILSDPDSLCAVTDTDTKISIIVDGDSTYTLKNRLGGAENFAIQLVGR